MKFILLLLIMVSVAPAQDMPRFRTWKASVAVLGAAQAADIASSYGSIGTERNQEGVLWPGNQAEASSHTSQNQAMNALA